VYGDSMYIVAGWNRVGYFDDFYCFNFSECLDLFEWMLIRITSNYEMDSDRQ
jgi:hypothetical protein